MFYKVKVTPRVKGEEGVARAFYCTMVGRQIVILHGFVKKMQETPDSELKIARKRLKEVRRNG
jgi:phage-related protein